MKESGVNITPTARHGTVVNLARFIYVKNVYVTERNSRDMIMEAPSALNVSKDTTARGIYKGFFFILIIVALIVIFITISG